MRMRRMIAVVMVVCPSLAVNSKPGLGRPTFPQHCIVWHCATVSCVVQSDESIFSWILHCVTLCDSVMCSTLWRIQLFLNTAALCDTALCAAITLSHWLCCTVENCPLHYTFFYSSAVSKWWEISVLIHSRAQWSLVEDCIAHFSHADMLRVIVLRGVFIFVLWQLWQIWAMKLCVQALAVQICWEIFLVLYFLVLSNTRQYLLVLFIRFRCTALAVETCWELFLFLYFLVLSNTCSTCCTALAVETCWELWGCEECQQDNTCPPHLKMIQREVTIVIKMWQNPKNNVKKMWKIFDWHEKI